MQSSACRSASCPLSQARSKSAVANMVTRLGNRSRESLPEFDVLGVDAQTDLMHRLQHLRVASTENARHHPGNRAQRDSSACAPAQKIPGSRFRRGVWVLLATLAIPHLALAQARPSEPASAPAPAPASVSAPTERSAKTARVAAARSRRGRHAGRQRSGAGSTDRSQAGNGGAHCRTARAPSLVDHAGHQCGPAFAADPGSFE